MRQKFLAVLVLAGALCGYWMVLGAHAALADEWSSPPDQQPTPFNRCPDPPASYTGTDATVAAITQLDADVVSSCKAQISEAQLSDFDAGQYASALKGGLNNIDTDLSQPNDGSILQDLDNLRTDVQGVTAQLASWTTANPLAVQTAGGGGPASSVQVTNWPNDQTVGLDSTSSGQLDGNAQSEHGDLWVLIGVIVGCFALDVALRKIWP